MLGVDISIWMLGAIITVGLTQWVKGFLCFIPKKFSWIYSVVSVCISIVVGFYSGGANVVWDILGILTISQLGYEFILQSINKKIKES